MIAAAWNAQRVRELRAGTGPTSSIGKELAGACRCAVLHCAPFIASIMSAAQRSVAQGLRVGAGAVGVAGAIGKGGEAWPRQRGKEVPALA